jgi:NAD+ synthase
MKNLDKRIVSWLRDYIEKCNLEYFVIGVSGGIDSAVTSTLCALTEKPVVVVSLPIHQESNQLIRANEHIEWLKLKFSNVESKELDLSQVYDQFKTTVYDNCLIEYNQKLDINLALANSRSRLRMVTLYQIATSLKGLVVGTGNKVEDFGVGFYTKYGDGGVDISPIADLYKSQVTELGKTLGINSDIIEAAPTDGLWEDDRTDEDQIGASYNELEWAMTFDKDDNSLSDREKTVLTIYRDFNTKNQHKMNPIPVFKL